MEVVQADDVDVGVMRVLMKNAGAKETKFSYFSKGKPVSSWLEILQHFSLQILIL